MNNKLLLFDKLLTFLRMVVEEQNHLLQIRHFSCCSLMMMMVMMMIIMNGFVVWSTDKRRLAFFLVGTIVRNPDHRESPTRCEQDLNLHKT